MTLHPLAIHVIIPYDTLTMPLFPRPKADPTKIPEYVTFALNTRTKMRGILPKERRIPPPAALDFARENPDYRLYLVTYSDTFLSTWLWKDRAQREFLEALHARVTAPAT